MASRSVTWHGRYTLLLYNHIYHHDFNVELEGGYKTYLL